MYKKEKASFESGGLLIQGNAATWYPIAPFFFFFFKPVHFLSTLSLQIDILVSRACISLTRLRGVTVLCSTKKHYH